MAPVMAARRFVDELLEVIRSTPYEQLKDVIQQRWGGEQVYIERGTAERKVEALAAEIAKGTPVKDAMKAAGVSRRTGYRILSRKWKVRDF